MPEITQVTPLSGVTLDDVQFSVTVNGTPPFTYAWDFGGGCSPNTSSSASPNVMLSAAGLYYASLTVTNAAGSDVFDFTLDVTSAPVAPAVSSVSPTSGTAGSQVQFGVSISGTPPFTYAWDFGGGASPNTSSNSSPSVTLEGAGLYSASLSVTNAYGSDTYNWDLTVGDPPSITNVTPTSGIEGQEIKFVAIVGGSVPMSYLWDFGEGASPSTSEEESPTVTLAAVAGSYNAQLQVTNDFGVDAYPFILTVDPLTSDGYTLFCPFVGSTNTYLIDMDGSVKHTWTSAYRPGACAKFRPNGNLLRLCDLGNTNFGGGKAGRIEERDWNNDIVWSFELSNNKECFHHDFEIMPNGNILLNHWYVYSKEEAIAAGRDPAKVSNSGIWTVKVLEIEPTLPSGGNIVWEWDAFDHLVQDFDNTKLNYGNPAMHPELMDFNYVSFAGADWLHVNAVAYNADLDQIVISVNGISEIWVIDHSTTTEEAASHTGGRYGRGGDILYRWGNPEVYRAGSSDDRQLYSQHNAHWIENNLSGAGDILIFNNQPGAPTGQSFSSIVQITTPINGDGSYFLTGGKFGPDEPTWEYTSTPKSKFYSSLMSSSQRLPGGNTLICSANQKWLFEVTPVGETVWEYYNPFPTSNPGTVFSALRYPYDFPGFDNMP